MSRFSERLWAEAIGTGLLVAAVVGSGIMATSLTSDIAVALLANTIATGAMLAVLITDVRADLRRAFQSGGLAGLRAQGRTCGGGRSSAYVAAQIAGGVAGTLIAHLMFGRALRRASQTARTGGAQWLSEGVAAFGLVLVILLQACASSAARSPGWSGSTSRPPTGSRPRPRFANPAVAIARSLTDSFAGIRPVDLPASSAAEFVGGARWRSRSVRWLSSHPNELAGMTITIYHNPDCGTSRNTLAMIRASGEEPVVIEYLKTPPSRERLRRADRRDGHVGRATLLREKGTPYAELGLDDRVTVPTTRSSTPCWPIRS